MDNNEPITSPIITSPDQKSRRIILSPTVKQLLLMLSGIILMVLFFLLPANKIWFNEKLIGHWSDFNAQHKDLSLEKRKKQRFGGTYIYSKQIADSFAAKPNKKDILVLLPSESYFKKNGITYEVPEAVTFYYFTGLRTVWFNKEEAIKANWIVRAKDKNIFIDSVTSMTQLKQAIEEFKK